MLIWSLGPLQRILESVYSTRHNSQKRGTCNTWCRDIHQICSRAPEAMPARLMGWTFGECSPIQNAVLKADAPEAEVVKSVGRVMSQQEHAARKSPIAVFLNVRGRASRL